MNSTNKQTKSTGSLWYNQQTYRAINQAIGRVIRHRNDYGAIMLCDERFGQAGSISQLPGWMRNHVRRASDFAAAVRDLASFFNVAVDKFPMPVPKIPSLQGASSRVAASGGGFFVPGQSSWKIFC